MMVMLGCVENLCLVTAGAQRVGLRVGLATVWIMAVSAGDTGLVHLALYEGAMYEHFILDLPIGVVKARFE
jgi:hypothetical protein